jgi:tetratricopeptide (TPR) repeat protein
MNIRTAAVMCFCLCAASASYAFETDYLYMKSVLYGGIAAAAMTDFNSGISREAPGGYGASLEKINAVQAAGLSVMPVFRSDIAGLMAPYLKFEFYSASNVSRINYPGGTISEKISPGLSVYYAGLGLRKYFDGWGSLIPFVSADAGINIAVNNYVEKLYYDTSGLLSSAVVIDLNGCFAGASISTGCEFDVLDFAGIEAVLGYTSAGGNLDSYYRSTDQGTNGKKGVFKADFSGVFAKAGVTFNFMQGQPAGKNIKNGPEPGNKAVAAMPVSESAVTASTPTEGVVVTSTETAVKTKKRAVETAKSTATHVPEATMASRESGKNILQKIMGNIKKDNNSPDALLTLDPEELSGALEAKGDQEFKKNDFVRAAEYYVKALTIRDDALLNKKAGNSYYYAGNRTEAEKYYEQSLKLNPVDSRLKEFLDIIK